MIKNHRSAREKVLCIYNRLYKYFGPQDWWPANDAFEVIIGAILTQNTSWENAKKALHALKKNKILSYRKLKAINIKKLAKYIKSSGFYNQKAKKIKNFLEFLDINYKGSLKKMFSESIAVLRDKLLSVNGLGPETVDSIMLYSGGKSIFVVDKYTVRFLRRHKLIENEEYGSIQRFFMQNLPSCPDIFNEFHALIVELGKHFCKTKKECRYCPLNSI